MWEEGDYTYSYTVNYHLSDFCIKMGSDESRQCYKWFWSCLSLSEVLHVYTPSRTLRSSSDTRMLESQQYKRKTHGFRAFSCFGTPHLEFTPTRP